MKGLKIKRENVFRMACGAALLMLLAVCGYAGAYRADTAVSVPVTVVYEQENQASALLDSVIKDPEVSKETKDSALAEKVKIAKRLDKEAQAEKLLCEMGFEGTSVLCSEAGVTIVTTEKNAASEKERTRMTGAVSGLLGTSGEDIKIILAKK